MYSAYMLIYFYLFAYFWNLKVFARKYFNIMMFSKFLTWYLYLYSLFSYFLQHWLHLMEILMYTTSLNMYIDTVLVLMYLDSVDTEVTAPHSSVSCVR